ncbi:hybrid sensor histidine kinase/response regulator [Zavarzinella formosa]|uniref:hybrid sensor histidine kinase/response regulator n=1 Tax=Zavarzinella formosa TaxID=360055 RepID=UPI000366C38F|nr:response regulator [Zavarzinella formosa]
MSPVPLRLLFVEDSEDDVLLLTRHLRQGGYQPIFERVDTADGLRASLHRGGWEIVISDYCMPRFSGLEALNITLQVAPDVPFILISGTVGEEVAVESIKAGASDYLMKQNLIRFVPAISRALRDAAERKTMRRAESVLREQRSLLSMVFDNTSDILILYAWDAIDAAWKLAAINRATLLIARGLGAELTEAELMGQRMEAVTRPLLVQWCDDPESVFDDFYAAAESGRPKLRELRLAGAGRELFLEVIFIPFFGPDGRTRHVVAVGRDVSSRKKAEEDRRGYEARLAQSRKMEALGQLAGGVAHDFNNILTGILGFADVISHTAEGTPKVYAGEIVQASSRARELIRQILMFSRRQPSVRRPVKLSPVVNEVMPLIRPLCRDGITLDWRPPKDEPHISGDPTQLHQVILNLMTNACQAMGELGRLCVSVNLCDINAEFSKAHPPLPEGPGVVLVVEDNGPGMPNEVRERLFEPFFTTKPPGVGTGLGLSVVHGIVQNHEGAILVETEPGEGTRFAVYFPAVIAPTPPPLPAMAAKPKSGNPRRILFVDDESSITRLAQVMLRNMGHTVSTFNVATEALEVLGANPQNFDVVVTDLTMPGMTGLEFARGIREIRKDLPIVLSSGYADDVPEETLRELGIVQVLPKPFQMQSLGEAVAKASLP